MSIKVRLLYDGSADSREAKEKLSGTGAYIECIPASGTLLPAARVGDTTYRGKHQIDALVDALKKEKGNSA